MWAVRAGITKDITFHSGRHTFAVLMLDLGAEIYTLQNYSDTKKFRPPKYMPKSSTKEARGRVDDTEHLAGGTRYGIAATAFFGTSLLAL